MNYSAEQNRGFGSVASGRKKKKKMLAGLISLAIVGGAAYTATFALKDQATAEGNIVAKINGDSVYASEVESQFTLLNQEQNRKVPFETLNAPQKEAIIKEYAAQKLLVAKAKEQGLDKDADVQSKVNQLLKEAMLRQVVKESITGDAVKSRYDVLVANLVGKEQVKVRHILVKTEEEANKVAEKLEKKDASFEKLAKEYSLDQATAKAGGDLGVLITGTMIKEFEQAVLALKKGEVSAPVKTSAGWHIIRLEDREPAKALAFDEVKQQIAQELTNKAIKEYIGDLMKGVDIKMEGGVSGGAEGGEDSAG